jgi:tRNA pseudouridine55 synthase
MDGLILIDKPQGLTSHDVVVRVRKILSEPRVGHFGTLDPLATGLLLLAAGQATRLFQLFAKTDKRYQGTIRLGYSTDTYDAMGRRTSPEEMSPPDRGLLAEAVEAGAAALLREKAGRPAALQVGPSEKTSLPGPERCGRLFL